MASIHVEDLGSSVGQTVGQTDWHQITQEAINEFGRLTGDEQWIHTDPDRAAAGPFKGPIAHGLLTLSLATKMLDECLTVEGAAMAINYGLDKVRFPAPVPAGSRVRGTAVLESLSEIQGGVQLVTRLSVDTETGQKPVCVAQMVTRYLS